MLNSLLFSTSLNWCYNLIVFNHVVIYYIFCILMLLAICLVFKNWDMKFIIIFVTLFFNYTYLGLNSTKWDFMFFN